MTNRDMVKLNVKKAPAAEGKGQRPNPAPLPPMPADEGSPTPSVREEPMDSPQPNPELNRAPLADGALGLTTRR